jgi:DNA polymerase-3 subunit gamma/tau
MAYQSLYRRYRPRRFSEVRGQEHLVSALRNAVLEDRVGHAYLLSGPRGTGKTSTARILAKVLNCENPVDGEPCGVCPSCVAIDAGTSFDVHELDAASNNGVDAIRDLIAKASLGTPGRTKVYILDEVHMLSTPASNALLKTLEEPPEHVVFVLATTDPQKVLPTIRSRTQHFDLHLLPAADLEALVDFVVTDAALDVDADARAYVLRAGAGSARDTLSALDRVVAAGGVPDDLDSLDELVEALCDRDTGRALIAVESATARGRSPRVLGEALIARLRDVFLAAVHADLSRLSEADRERAREQAQRLTAAGATRALEVLGDAFVGIQDALDPRIPLEVALVRLTRADLDTAPAALAERVSRLEQALADGGPAPGPTSRPGPARPPAATTTPAPPVVDESPAAHESVDERPAPDEPAPATPPSAGTDRPARPADIARDQLSRTRSATGGAPRSSPTTTAATSEGTRQPPAPSRSPGAPPTSPPATSAAPARPADPAAADDATSAQPRSPDPTPARDGDSVELQLSAISAVWTDLLGNLPQRPKVRFAGGRWLSVTDGVATFGLPNPVHAQRCEECRGDVEAALTAHFGRPVSVRVVVDGDAEEPTDHGAPRPQTAEADEDVDVHDLTDAEDVAETGVERVAAVFPGAQRVDPPPDRLL